MLAMTATAVDYGWQPLEGGGIEYVIRLEPGSIESLRAGQDIASELPPDLAGLKSFRITFIPGEPPPPAKPQEPTLAPTEPANSGTPHNAAMQVGPPNTGGSAPFFPSSPTQPNGFGATTAPQSGVYGSPPTTQFGGGYPGASSQTGGPNYANTPPYSTNAPVNNPYQVQPSQPTAPTLQPALVDDERMDVGPSTQPQRAAYGEQLAANTGIEPTSRVNNVTDAARARLQEAADTISEEERPWIWTLGLLITSVGLNFYLGGIVLAQRQKYHELVEESRAA